MAEGDKESHKEVMGPPSQPQSQGEESGRRERSKTPPPITNAKGFAQFLGLGAEEERSRDSGVHLEDSASATPPNEVEDERHCKSSSLPHGVKLCPEKGLTNVAEDDSSRVCLEEELKKAQKELEAKDAEVEVLKGIRQQVEGELEDLTASLFQEAHKMVTEAKMKEVASEKSLTEARMQLEGLEAEVSALKALLITSTPSRPNLGSGSSNGLGLFKKAHKRTPSLNTLQYGRDNEPNTPTTETSNPTPMEVAIDRARCDVDPILLARFGRWRASPTLGREGSEFLAQIYVEDIEPCLSFGHQGLVTKLKDAIHKNSIWLEPLPEKERNNVPKECALLQCPRVCHYRMRFSHDSEEWFDISQMSRDRIAAVCEFLAYCRYTEGGLVKASVEDAYWEMLRLRKQMAMAKLGISISS